MNNQQVLRELNENYFDYYKFKRSFGLAFLLIGLTYLLFYTLVLATSFVNNLIEIMTSFLTIFWYFLFIVISLYLAIIIKSLTKAQRENGELTKSKVTFGILLVILIVFFANILMDPTILYIFYQLKPNVILSDYDFKLYSIIEESLRYFILFALYFIETKLFFPDENNNSMKTISFVLFLIFVIGLVIWCFILLFEPYSNFNPIYLLFSFLLGILFSLYGLFEMKTSPKIQ